jgi:hypothetical protein
VRVNAPRNSSLPERLNQVAHRVLELAVAGDYYCPVVSSKLSTVFTEPCTVDSAAPNHLVVYGLTVQLRPLTRPKSASGPRTPFRGSQCAIWERDGLQHMSW